MPIVNIFNCITSTHEWPKDWNIEYVTVIPKVPIPESPGDCRNISCTNFLSKLYESFVLKWSRKLVNAKRNRYGGEKKCSSTHFLIDAMDEMTTDLEDNRNVCVVTSIDFSKAFNRLQHLSCLQAFQRKGASTEIIALLASFMSGRKMAVRIGSRTSSFKAVNAGAPQGSVLGSYLFAIGIDDIEEGCSLPELPFIQLPDEHLNEVDYPASSTPARIGPSDQPVPVSPMGAGVVRRLGDFSLLPRVANAPPWMRGPKDPTWRRKPPLDIVKYIDDGLDIVIVNIKTVALCYEGHPPRPTKTIYPVESQAVLDNIIKNASEKGMVVNDSKTSLLCVTAATSFEAKAFLKMRDRTTIKSKQSMKLLGYIVFDQDCGQASNVSAICAKLRSRSWALPVPVSYTHLTLPTTPYV